MKLKVTLTTEYEPNPEHYGTEDPAEMARVDQANWEEDAAMLLASFDNEDFKITVEPLP